MFYTINCNTFSFTRHAAMQMFERKISIKNVKSVLRHGEIIQEYPDDKPYPSFLVLYIIEGRPLHVVVGQTQKFECIVITAYQPSKHLWSNHFKTRRK